MPSASRRPRARYPSVIEDVEYTSTSEPEYFPSTGPLSRWSGALTSPPGPPSTLPPVGALFGTDGIRGIAGRDLTPGLARRIGRATALVLRDHGDPRPRVVVGRDTRASGPELEAALADGICS